MTAGRPERPAPRKAAAESAMSARSIQRVPRVRRASLEEIRTRCRWPGQRPGRPGPPGRASLLANKFPARPGQCSVVHTFLWRTESSFSFSGSARLRAPASPRPRCAAPSRGPGSILTRNWSAQFSPGNLNVDCNGCAMPTALERGRKGRYCFCLRRTKVLKRRARAKKGTGGVPHATLYGRPTR